MKTKTYILILIAITAASCTSLQQSTVNDDIYYSPKDQLTANNNQKVNTLQTNNSTIFGNDYDKQITDILEDESIEEIDTTIIVENTDPNSFENIIVDDYNDAWNRRRDARNSPYYGSPSYFIQTTDAYRYATIYANDPYYNVVIIGDQIWVEPYYISASFGYGYYSSFYYNPFYSPYYGSCYSSYYYRPFYYNDPYYNPRFKSYYSVDNPNYASSSFHSQRQRSLSSRSATRSSAERTSRTMPETYAGRDIGRSSTVKSGLDRQRVSAERSPRTRSADVATPRIVKETTRTRTAATSSTNRNYTRPQSTARSTYNATNRSTSRYNRPSSSNANSGRSQGTSRSTYAPSKNATSSSRSGSTYRKSGSSSGKSSGSSSRSSVKSSGSSSSSGRSSGSSGRSSGSSGSSSRSSGSSSRSGGGRR
jgi:hypothetical protein